VFSDVLSNAIIESDHDLILIDSNGESESEGETELENEVKKEAKLHQRSAFDLIPLGGNSKERISEYISSHFLSPNLEIFSPPPEHS
jgi:hypothetical protein